MLAVGTRLGSYEVVSVLGVGGMGEVYRARDTRLQRDVAVKVLPEAFASDPERLARFEREAQLLASLNHPHIAAIYGLEESLGGSEPLWAHDGRELLYRGPDGAVMRVPIEADTVWKAGAPAQVLRAGYYEGDDATILQRTYDISPDGRRFVMIKEGAAPADAAQTARIIVVENWLEELKRRVPAP